MLPGYDPRDVVAAHSKRSSSHHKSELAPYHPFCGERYPITARHVNLKLFVGDVSVCV